MPDDYSDEQIIMEYEYFTDTLANNTYFKNCVSGTAA